MKVLFLQKDPFVNLGIMGISAYLKQKGHECSLLIENAEKNFLKAISRERADIIAFPCTTGVHTWALKMAGRIKKYSDIPILMGGSHPTFYPEVIENKNIDIICIGEGEEAFAELLDKMQEGKDYSRVKSLWVKKNGKVYKNPVRKLINDLDSLPIADRFLYKKYKFIMNQRNFRIISGRGCPYNCTFCFNKSIKELYRGKGQYVRRRSVDNVINELVKAKRYFKIKRIDFQDDTFIYNFENWLKPFLQEYKENVGLPFTCCVRANLVTKELAIALKRGGCHSVKMGIENGNEFLNNKVLGKNLSKKQIFDAVRHLKKAGLKVEAFNILGVPGETVSTALETLRFNMKLGVDFARCSLLQPYPKTEIEEYAKENGYLDKNYDLNVFESSYFMDTPVKLRNKNAIINLQRLFDVSIRFPFMYPIIKRLIFLPKNFIFDTIFKIDYAISIFLIDKISIFDFIAFGIRSKGFFKK